MLEAEINERLAKKKENLLSSLKEVSSVSTAVDVWSVSKKMFMLVIVNWIDSTCFQRVSSVIGCDVLLDTTSSEILTKRFQEICSEFGLCNKIVATVTNNNQPNDKSDETDETAYLQLVAVPDRIKNPTYLLESIGIEEAEKALADEPYAMLHKSAFAKFNALLDHTKNVHLSEKPILNGIFNVSSVGSKVNEIYNFVSNLVTCNHENLNEILSQLDICAFTETDMNFFKEYAVILEPIATAIEYLQKNNCYYATLLPMVYSMKDSLTDVKNRNQIHLCLPLVTAILSGVEHTFAHLFDFNNEKCVPAIIATCTHPFFKMRWLKGDLKTPTNTNQILDLLVKVAKEYDDGIKKECDEQTTTATNGKN